MAAASLAEGLVRDEAAEGRKILHDQLPELVVALEWLATVVELAAIAVMALGAARFVVRFAAAELSGSVESRLHGLDLGRVDLGRYILSGLELLIVADIIHTALSLALRDLLYLGLLVLIRSAISYFLTREIRDLGAALRR